MVSAVDNFFASQVKSPRSGRKTRETDKKRGKVTVEEASEREEQVLTDNRLLYKLPVSLVLLAWAQDGACVIGLLGLQAAPGMLGSAWLSACAPKDFTGPVPGGRKWGRAILSL